MTTKQSPAPLRRMAGLAAALVLMGGSAPSAGQAGEALAPDVVLPDASPLAQPTEEAIARPQVESPATEAAHQALGSGVASWYGPEFAGRRTASGERFDPAQMTAAHRTLPFGSMVRVTRIASGKSVVVRINDRGPFTRGRVIDLSQAAAREIDIIRAGSGEVSLELLDS